MLESNKSCLVRDRLKLGADNEVVFNWCWKRNLRNGREKSQLLNICEILSEVRLKYENDRWLWLDGRNGEFTVKALRHLVIACCEFQKSSFKWISWIPLKINCFVWRMFQNRIPLLVNLAARNVAVSSSSVFFTVLPMRIRIMYSSDASFLRSSGDALLTGRVSSVVFHPPARTWWTFLEVSEGVKSSTDCFTLLPMVPCG